MAFFPRVTMTPELEAQTQEFIGIQEKFRSKIQAVPLPKSIRTIAGCDSAFIGDQILSVFVVFSFPDLMELEVQFHISPVTIPYIPGFLSFREIPNLLTTYQKLTMQPDVIMVDGQGIMHPRRLGIATHLGLLLNKPTVGVAKHKLTGHYQPPGQMKGDVAPIFDHQQQLGYVVRSKDNVKPLFVSPGHLCTLKDALAITIQTVRRHKLPEPTRIADQYSKSLKPQNMPNKLV